MRNLYFNRRRGRDRPDYRVGQAESSGLLWLASFHTPVPQTFPTTAAGLAAVVGATPTSIWGFQESSGSQVSDLVASNHFTASNVGTSIFRGQSATGLYPATNAWESGRNVATNDFTGADLANPSTTTSWALLMVWRSNDGSVLSGDQHLISRTNTTSAGWELVKPTASGTTLAMRCYDGFPSTDAIISTTHNDDSWHYTLMWYKSDKTFGIKSDIGEATSSTTNAPAYNSQPLRIGYTEFYYTNETQYRYLAYFEGAQADSLIANRSTAMASFWKHASDPSSKINTSAISRTKSLSVPASATTVAHYSGPAKQIVQAYDSSITQGSNLGLVVSQGPTNLCRFSDTPNSWTTKSAVTISSAIADLINSPGGFREVHKITATSTGSSFIRITFAGAASTEYTFSVWLKSSNGAQGSISLGDDSAGTIVFTTFNLTDTNWTLVRCTGTTDPGSTAWTARIDIDTNTNILYMYHASIQQGKYQPIFTRTNGIAITGDALWYRCDLSGLPSGLSNRGALSAQVKPFLKRSTGDGCLLKVGRSSRVNERAFFRDANAESTSVLHYKENGTTFVAPVGGTLSTSALNKISTDWSVVTPIRTSVSQETWHGTTGVPTSQATANQTDTATTEPNRVYLGAYLDSGSANTDGLIVSAKLYNKPKGPAGP